jgi:ABC-type polysaccharide/polyol phosphate export permease
MESGSTLTELWRFREVLKNFVAQDLKVRYRRSFLGFFWSLLNPLLQMIVLSVVFSLIFRMEDIALYLLAGLVPWSFFSVSVDGCSMCIVGAESMLKRQYFPKLVFPLSVVLQNLVTFVLSLGVLLLVLGWAIGFHPSPALLILPVSFACLFCVALGVGAFAAVVTVYFRDMQHLISVFMSTLFYLTPIIYPLEIKRAIPDEPPAARTQPTTTDTSAAQPSSAADGAAAQPASAPEYYKKSTVEGVQGPIPHRYRFYFKLNPLYSIIEMFHRPIYDEMLPTNSELAVALGAAAVSLIGGLAVFRRFENRLIFAL